MNAMKQMFVDVFKAAEKFFFAPVSPLSIGVFRFVFGLVAFAMYSVRFVNWRFYYTDEGFLPATASLEILPEFFRPPITWYPADPTLTLLCYIGFLIALACLTLGIFGRVAAIVALFFHIMFLQRNYAIGYGSDFIATFFFFSLVLAQNDRAFSLRAWLDRVKPEVPDSLNQYLNTIGLRLLQLHLCIIYSYTGLEKMKGTSWWEGTAVWSVIGNPQLMIFDASWLQMFPVLIALMTFMTLFFEVYFAVLVWIKGTRKWILMLGVALHGGIGVMIGLMFFSLVMLSAYIAFLDVDWLKARLQSWGVPQKLLT
ncbi:MAG TPA: HTTM domain-containing protein [Bdellovibrionales bacterium]|nr:HTTM domain-containing protein [Bdellovibrionales bacterium]